MTHTTSLPFADETINNILRCWKSFIVGRSLRCFFDLCLLLLSAGFLLFRCRFLADSQSFHSNPFCQLFLRSFSENQICGRLLIFITYSASFRLVVAYIEVNRIPVTAPLTGQPFRVICLGGCISLKKRSQRPILRHSTSSFKGTQRALLYT